jgi:hypothetical protein
MERWVGLGVIADNLINISRALVTRRLNHTRLSHELIEGAALLHSLEQKLDACDRDLDRVPLPSKELLMTLAQDLPAIWNAPSTDMRLKQRIIRIVITEIVADVDDSRREIVLILHWVGGRHSELRLKKRETGQHRRCTPVEAVDVVRQLAGRFSDELIAATLNRLGMRTGMDYTWNKECVYSLRHYQ